MGHQIQLFLTKQDIGELFELELRAMGAMIVPLRTHRMEESYANLADYYANCDWLSFYLVREDMAAAIVRRRVPSGWLVAGPSDSPLIELGPSRMDEGGLHRTRMFYDSTSVASRAVDGCPLEEFPKWAENVLRKTRKVLEKRRIGSMVCYLGRGALEFERQGGTLAMN